MQQAILALADGRIFKGFSFGARHSIDKPVIGEVVFNTSMTGYQEILTDPSYCGQIMTFTYPHIGNVGCNIEDVESKRIWVEGVIIRNLSKIHSNFRADRSLSLYLEERGILGICGIDTRDLVTHIRTQGAQMGAMACGDDNIIDTLVDIAKANIHLLGKDYVADVSCRKTYSWEQGAWELGSGYQRYGQQRLMTRPHLVALDCGIKHNILRLLTDCGFRVSVAPAFSTAEEILSLCPDALFLSNGPGDPAVLQGIVVEIKKLIGRFPIFGICLGHQILAQVFGGKTYKLKFGHRGANHPVKNTMTGIVEITSQNHGYAVTKENLPKDVKVSHLNLNDMTVEGLSIPDARAFSIQYHPEASPGPHDAKYLFRQFFEMVVEPNKESTSRFFESPSGGFNLRTNSSGSSLRIKGD
ncbi:MAG: glutamine-hydrolyzing carbamoyl-phosphate synthase small subunit [SAR324 cluster bacterium]|uniref:Carbamoyl phosphate synthase small chain n=1 Tax=SAR324 cluster bacterium TaxID=2024889 RepID=A0A7X9FPC3_9DELT|nr:glutamine-hydrolyzing carbamoyl-phosphate synthase small subunit [SAR324 cluster bacterium]